MEGAPVLELIEHSVLEKFLEGGPMEGMPVLEPLDHSVLVMTLDCGPMEGAPVLEPIEHSVLENPLDGGPMEGMSVLEPLEHSVRVMTLDDRPLVEMSVLEPLEHSVPNAAPVGGGGGDCSLIEGTVSGLLEHSGLCVHMDIYSLWMAPWDAGGTLSSSYRPGVAVWRAVLYSVVRLSRRPVLSVTGYSRSFRKLGRTCILDLNAGK